ncbi:MAG: hypothetical protein K5683_01650 [Prevotella sp.]|nr:hypothetical protein [Prevotella sp.]
MIEIDTMPIVYVVNFNTSTQELVDESAVVIASLTTSSLIANLTVEDVY